MLTPIPSVSMVAPVHTIGGSQSVHADTVAAIPLMRSIRNIGMRDQRPDRTGLAPSTNWKYIGR